MIKLIKKEVGTIYRIELDDTDFQAILEHDVRDPSDALDFRLEAKTKASNVDYSRQFGSNIEFILNREDDRDSTWSEIRTVIREYLEQVKGSGRVAC